MVEILFRSNHKYNARKIINQCKTRYKPKIYSNITTTTTAAAVSAMTKTTNDIEWLREKKICRKIQTSYNKNRLINDLKNAMKRKWIAQSPNKTKTEKKTSNLSPIQSIVSQLQKMKLHETLFVQDCVFLTQNRVSTHSAYPHSIAKTIA